MMQYPDENSANLITNSGAKLEKKEEEKNQEEK